MAVSSWLFVFAVIFSVHLAFARKCPCLNPTFCKTIDRPPGKEFFFWTDQPKVWKQYDFNRITTIGIFRDWDDELFCYAHSKGVRVVITSNFPMDKLNNSQVREEWVQNKTKFAMENFADGINIDIEGPVDKQSKEVTLLTKLVKLTVDSFKKNIPGAQVTFDAAWSPDCVDGRCYDYKAIADEVDFMVIMAYDQQSQIKEGPCIAKANSPYEQTIKGVEAYKKLNISSSKLVLGLPWYGYDYECIKFDPKVKTCYIKEVPFRGVNCSDAAGRQITYSTVQDLLSTRTDTGRKWDVPTLSPNFWYNDQYGNVHQVWYDDPISLAIKYRYAMQYGKMRGIAIWNADLLDYSGLTRGTSQTNFMWRTLRNIPGVCPIKYPC